MTSRIVEELFGETSDDWLSLLVQEEHSMGLYQHSMSAIVD